MDKNFVTVRLTSPHFDCDRMQVRTLDGREAISGGYSFVVEVVTLGESELIQSQVVAADVDIVFEEDGVEARHVHGMVAQIDDLLDTEPDHHAYRIEIVPRTFRLSMVETPEVFLDMSVPDIVRAKLAMVGIGDDAIDLRLAGTYAPREFVVQYRETDLAFVSRLTENVGISYFFEQADGMEKLVLSDASSGHRPIVGDANIPFRGRGDPRDVFRIERRVRMIPAVYVMQDYNYRTPRVDLTSTYESGVGSAGGVVEYGAHHKTPLEGMALAAVRAEERESRHHYFEGDAAICRFAAGATFDLVDHARLPDAKLLLVEVEHHVVQTVMSTATGKESPYRCSFKAIEARRNYRPARVTPKPRIHGFLTATVEHELGEAPGLGRIARIDEHGRYMVRFHFDPGSAKRKRSSRPLRMVQPHAGPNYGMHFPLKPDAEVVVTFVDGDPDRPVIAGAVPNAVTASPVNRSNAMMHTIQTASGITIAMKDTP
jgi:type VI secretion system secreted protein VgrG